MISAGEFGATHKACQWVTYPSRQCHFVGQDGQYYCWPVKGGMSFSTLDYVNGLPVSVRANGVGSASFLCGNE